MHETFCYFYTFHWRPISSSRSILPCDRLEFVLIPFWFLLYLNLIAEHHCPNDAAFFAHLTGTSQCPTSSLNAISSRQRYSNDLLL